MSKILDVYLHNTLAGKLEQDNSGNLSFAYNTEYLERNLPALSISLPLQEETFDRNTTKAFFSGFLPEDLIRQRLAKYLGVSDKNPFALLEVIGGECAGALSLYPEGMVPTPEQTGDIEVLDNKKLSEVLEILKCRPLLAGEDNLRLSLAGAQNKIAVGMQEGKVAIIKGTTPTTHILKPLIEDITDSTHNELFCMRLAKMVGIDVPEANIGWSGKTPYFIVERYDRTTDKQGKTTRLHQEDFCQALGIMPEMKYEAEGGPGIAQCQKLIKAYSAKPAKDDLRFLDVLIFNYLIGNNDAHGKNFSLLYNGSKPELSPAYDLLSTEVYPDLSKKMAMKIGGKYKAEDIFIRHWHRIIPDTATAKKSLEKRLKELALTCVTHAPDLKKTLKTEGITSPIIGKIEKVIKKRAATLEKGL